MSGFIVLTAHSEWQDTVGLIWKKLASYHYQLFLYALF